VGIFARNRISLAQNVANLLNNVRYILIVDLIVVIIIIKK
jgi:hypothetical protein